MTVVILLVWCLYCGDWKISDDVFFMIWLPLALHVLTAIRLIKKQTLNI
jgi:hypothetical protein